MINVSAEFRETMQERTNFKCNADVTLTDSTVLRLDETHFTISNNSVTDAAGANTLPLGVAVSRSIQIELMNDREQYQGIDFFGAKIRLFLTFELSQTTEKIEMGTFTVLDPETYGETVIITAQDDMYKADKPYYTNEVFPTTLAALYRDACAECGIPFLTSNFANNDFVVPAGVEVSEDFTFREMFGYIAMIAGGNARINRSGYMEILSYDLTATHHELSEWRTLKADTNDITITGIQTEIEVEGEEGTEEQMVLVGEEGYVVEIENPLILGQEETALALIGSGIVGIPFRKFEGDHIAYPLVEFMDTAAIINRKGETFSTVITDINFVFFGFTTMSNSTASALRNAATYSSDTSKAVILAKKLVEKEKTQRELAVESLNQALSESSGMYETQVQQSDGSIIYYLHDKPTLEASQNVLKLTSEAIGFSIDGGQTYPYGFTITGEMIVQVLSAEGINADWINTGALTITDRDGNIIFKADTDTKEVYVSADSVMMGFGEEASNVSDAISESITTSQANTMSAIQSNNAVMLQQMSEDYYSKTETEEKLNDLSTNVANANSNVEGLGQALQESKDSTNEQFAAIRRYIRFEDGNIVLGEVGNEIMLRIENDRIGFLQTGAEVAYFSNNKLYVEDAEILASLRIGKFAFVPRQNGNMSLKKVVD